MWIECRWGRGAAVVLAGVALWNPGLAAQSGGAFVTAVEATHPIAFYRLDGPAGKSLVGTTTFRPSGGVSTGSGPSAPIGVANNQFAVLDGHDGYILTTQTGGVGETASMMAWVNLAELPSKAGRFLYIEGESQSGNDLDVQF